MTTTEQDKELQELVDKFINDIAVLRPYTRVTKEAKRRLAQLITADRKRVALEERLDELNNVRSMWTKPGIGDIKFGHWLHYRQKTLVDLAELKAQQEEV